MRPETMAALDPATGGRAVQVRLEPRMLLPRVMSPPHEIHERAAIRPFPEGWGRRQDGGAMISNILPLRPRFGRMFRPETTCAS